MFYQISPINDTVIQIQNMKFTVIIPTFNRSKMLAEAISSVRGQSMSDDLYEIIGFVVDNASRDVQKQIQFGNRWLLSIPNFALSQEAAASGSLSKALYYWLLGVKASFPESLEQFNVLRILKGVVTSTFRT